MQGHAEHRWNVKGAVSVYLATFPVVAVDVGDNIVVPDWTGGDTSTPPSPLSSLFSPSGIAQKLVKKMKKLFHLDFPKVYQQNLKV
eukprot:15323855-Ditylum_brightwellii.AAC.1